MAGQSSTSAGDAYEILRGRLVRGDFRAGVRLTEEQLAAELQVSRTPIREALRRLVSDGLLRFVPNVGTFVASWTHDDIRDLFDLRVLLESNIASLAAQRIGAADIARLTEIQDQIELEGPDISPGNLQRINLLNREFHRVISSASGNSRMSEMLANAIEIPIVQQTFSRYSPAQLSRSFGHHREVIDAFAAGDAEWARDVMSCHVRAARSALLPPQPGGAADGRAPAAKTR